MVDFASSLEAVQVRHSNVQDSDARSERESQFDTLAPVRRFPADRPSRPRLDQGAEALSQDLVIVDQQHSNGAQTVPQLEKIDALRGSGIRAGVRS